MGTYNIILNRISKSLGVQGGTTAFIPKAFNINGVPRNVQEGDKTIAVGGEVKTLRRPSPSIKSKYGF